MKLTEINRQRDGDRTRLLLFSCCVECFKVSPTDWFHFSSIDWNQHQIYTVNVKICPVQLRSKFSHHLFFCSNSRRRRCWWRVFISASQWIIEFSSSCSLKRKPRVLAWNNKEMTNSWRTFVVQGQSTVGKDWRLCIVIIDDAFEPFPRRKSHSFNSAIKFRSILNEQRTIWENVGRSTRMLKRKKTEFRFEEIPSRSIQVRHDLPRAKNTPCVWSQVSGIPLDLKRCEALSQDDRRK